MGNTNDSYYINIKLDHPKPCFFAGETVSGTVFVNIKSKQVKVKNVFIELQGEIGYISTRSDVQQDGPSTTETVYNAIPFFNAKAILESREKGQKELVFCAGRYSWPFEFILPCQIPPSLNQPTDYPHVRYFVKFVMGKSWYKLDLSQVLYLFVYPRVNLSHNPHHLMRLTYESRNKKNIRVKVNLTRYGYLPGEPITGRFEIENPQQIELNYILLTLIQYYRIKREVYALKIFETPMPNVVNRTDKLIMQNFSVMIPSQQLPPSYSYSNGLGFKANVENSYYLKINVIAEDVLTDLEIEIPITIGTESN